MIALLAFLGLGGISEAIINGLLQQALPVLATIIAGMVIRLIQVTLKRFNLKLSMDQETVLREKVRAAIMRIEELTAQRPNAPASGSEKLRQAVSEVVTTTGVEPAEAAKLIHEELPKTRAVMWRTPGPNR